jgi:hypothetical protein
MSGRSENLRWLARKCEIAAGAATDPVTKAKFEQEQQQWLVRAEQAEKAENPSREGRLRRPALRSRR